MKIKIGTFVKVKPSTCQAHGLVVDRPYLVVHFHDVPPTPIRMKKGLWYPPHPVIILVDDLPGGASENKHLHVEDVALVPDEERLAPKPKRKPVDRVAVLLRLRRDFCLREGRYPTIDQEARQAARDEARKLIYWADFQEKMERFNPVTESGFQPGEVSVIGGYCAQRFVMASHGPMPMTADEHDEIERQRLNAAAVKGDAKAEKRAEFRRKFCGFGPKR